MTFEIHLVETTSDRNAFVVLPDGIRGQSRKPATNNFCEFKGLKLTCNEYGYKRRLLILAWLPDLNNPLARSAVYCFISPEVQVFSENGRLIQIEKLEQFRHYFELFDPDVFQKSIRRAEEDREHFYAYMLKKNPKIKNILYIAFKFPDIVSLYLNRSVLKNTQGVSEEQLSEQICDAMFSQQEIDESSQLHLVANYLNPNSRVIMKIDCPPDEFKFIINKDFTRILSVLVGDIIPIDEEKFMKLDKDVKPMYFQYYRSMVESDQESRKPHHKGEEQPADEEGSPYKALNIYDYKQSKSKGSSSRKQDEIDRRGRLNKEKRAKRKKGDDDDDDSLFVSDDQLDYQSDLSLSDKKSKKTSYAKWLYRSKRTTVKQKYQNKKADKFLQNSKADRAAHTSTMASIPLASSIGSGRSVSSQPPPFQQPQLSYLLMDAQQGFNPRLVPQQMQVLPTAMQVPSARIMNSTSGMIPTNVGSKFILGAPQMVNNNSPLMQVVQRDRYQDQQQQQQQKSNLTNPADKSSLKWISPVQQSNFMVSQQPQPTFVMGNPQLGYVNQMGQFSQFGQFGQNPAQMMTLPSQAFMTQQNLPAGYQSIVMADQFFNGQNQLMMRPALQYSSTQPQSGFSLSQPSQPNHNNGLKIEKDNLSMNSYQNKFNSQGVETRNQKNKQEKSQPTSQSKPEPARQPQQEMRPAFVMQGNSFPQQLSGFSMLPQMGLQQMMPQQGGLQYLSSTNMPTQAFYALQQGSSPMLPTQILTMRNPPTN